MHARLLLGAALLLSTAAHAEGPLPALPPLGVDPADTSVIGISSGGYMASQLAVAWPQRFTRLAVLAAGPWSCAEGGLGQALGQCMSTRRGPPDLTALDRRLHDYQARELVGDAAAIGRLRAFVWHGEADDVIAPALGIALAEQLSGWLDNPEVQLHTVTSPDIGHGWPVEASPEIPPDQLGQCHAGGSTHLLACDRNIATVALNWLHDSPETQGENASSAELLRFDQSEFAARGMADAGFLLVPSACEAGGCQVTVALHGCGMAEELIGEAFVRYSGLDAWATANQRVVLYPQAESSLANPQGCWDWWGFSESSWQLDPLHDTREGAQITALMEMLERLEQPRT